MKITYNILLILPKFTYKYHCLKICINIGMNFSYFFMGNDYFLYYALSEKNMFCLNLKLQYCNCYNILYLNREDLDGKSHIVTITLSIFTATYSNC